MPAAPLVVRAPAKVNLWLNITGRRADGYHELDSLFAFAGLADVLTFGPAAELVLDPPDGPFADAVGPDEGNLVRRAAALLAREAGVSTGARIGLTKAIPVAAGLGGGSADAAAALAGLNLLWDLRWPAERLERLSAALGADVPACVRNRPVIARGVGENLSPAPALPACGLLLATPRLPTPTPAVFAAFRAMSPVIRAVERPLPTAFRTLDDVVSEIGGRGNDLMPAAVAVTPAIADVLGALAALPGAACAALSGSGATCFALFADAAGAVRAAEALGRRRPGWWSWAGAFA
jgi:4-diphosphocytidyl-2-C-methyl-D-erythritol kinase